MGGLEVIDENVELKTFVGSCVALCLFDMQSKVAAMAHIMLPKQTSQKKDILGGENGKFADIAFFTMRENMIRKGAKVERIQAKMAGGATIFRHEPETNLFSIGSRNVEAVKQILKENGVPLVAEDTGMNFGRWVNFDLKSGKMTVISNLKKSQRIL